MLFISCHRTEKDTLNLNNKAVALYQSNDMAGAAKTYYESLCLVKELLKCTMTIPRQGSGVNHHSTNTLPQHECFHTSTETSINTPIQEKFFVYQSALVLQEAPSFGAEHRVQSMNICCAGILFNTAILHHQKSIKTGMSASMYQAEQLYQASLPSLHLQSVTTFLRRLRSSLRKDW
ncbi:unnamed protein product [Cylindrotheca closterium]|uniref:Uncharacterized protein n=1 Tax=Cylindrotheca closterium TaxID=2856 RepID=A0AAD2G921_9STRA|nr:unnamed protein product [Cylindrotheca closterium]